MTFPIRAVPDNDTAWGGDLRNVIEFVNSGWGPEDHGFSAWTNDPQLATSSTTPTIGVQYLIKVKVPVAFNCTIVSCYIATAGATVASSYLALYNTSGTRLVVTAAITTGFQSTGLFDGAVSSTALSAGYVYAGVLIGTGTTTAPALARSATVTSVGTAGPGNLNLSATTARVTTSGTSLNASPTPITMSGTSPTGQMYWIGLR